MIQVGLEVARCLDVDAQVEAAGPERAPDRGKHMTVSLAVGGMGLGAAWGDRVAREMLARAGFGRVDVNTVEGDIFNNYYVAHPT